MIFNMQNQPNFCYKFIFAVLQVFNVAINDWLLNICQSCWKWVPKNLAFWLFSVSTSLILQLKFLTINNYTKATISIVYFICKFFLAVMLEQSSIGGY